MANMSHCRFRNTLADLRDCHQALDESGVDPLEGLSDEEARAAKALVKMCARIADDYYEDIAGESR